MDPQRLRLSDLAVAVGSAKRLQQAPCCVPVVSIDEVSATILDSFCTRSSDRAAGRGVEIL